MIDTSGSMRSPTSGKLWSAVFTAIKEFVAENRDANYLIALDANGRMIFAGEQRWLEVTPANMERLEQALENYQEDTISSPVPGIYRAIGIMPANRKSRLRVCVIGDEFSTAEQADSVLRHVDELNPADAKGRRAASISAIQLPTTIRLLRTQGMGNTGMRYQALMSAVAARHGGTFKLLPNDALK